MIQGYQAKKCKKKIETGKNAQEFQKKTMLA